MTRVNVDTAAPAVKSFLRSLTVDASGVEIELAGRILCKIVPPQQLSEAAKAANVADMRELLRRARQRSKAVPAKTIERDIRAAMNRVRGTR
jgi:hypothetical protein